MTQAEAAQGTNDNDQRKTENLDVDLWSIVTLLSGHKILGCLDEDKHEFVNSLSTEETNKEFTPSELSKEIALQAWKDNGILCMYPAFYLKDDPMMAQGRDGQPQVQRPGIVLPYGFTAYFCPIWVKPIQIEFLRDMHQSDKAEYKKLIKMGFDGQNTMRAQRSGLVMGQAGNIPGRNGGAILSGKT